jgi:hypothetical protein
MERNKGSNLQNGSWVNKMIRKMVRRNGTERRKSKLSDAEITPHAIWPLEKSLKRGDKPKAPAAIHSSTGAKFLPSEKDNVIK